MIEFEVKARVPPAALEALQARLGEPVSVEAHRDAYYAHPARDFAKTDEALRLRSVGNSTELTYKGPKLDLETKTRREVTATVPDPQAMEAILGALGFSLVAEVRKVRRTYHYAGFDVALDELAGLGSFVELERRLPDGSETETARREAFAVLEAFGIRETLRTSYLEMVLANREPKPL